ncbi:hypothetical protein GGR56DRAFT_627165 [Xylariaceae sp. FL0804]|nr:hypothetical protein GGR56DRAFT_627165 [Xylariaceae sp. FL0804]
MRVAVIGAGPSGLVTLKHLLEAEKQLGTAPVEVRLFESDTGIGGTFRARTYEDGVLVSSRQLTTFSDFRQEDGPDFFSVPEYLNYLNDYCNHFGLWRYMSFGCSVQNVEKRTGGGHVLTYTEDGQEHQWECDAVAVCSGLHVQPAVPQVEGIERVPTVLHSSAFKSREQFGVGKTVMVLGSGETGSDVALLALTSPAERVILCHRNGFHMAPKHNPNPVLLLSRKRSPNDPPPVAVDVSRASLFDTAYVHPWLRKSNLLWLYYDYYIRIMAWLSWGTSAGADQWIGEKADDWKSSEIFFNKSGYRISPYMNVYWKPKRPQGLLEKIRYFLVRMRTADTKGRGLDVAPFPERVDAEGIVHFRDTGRREYEYIKTQRIKPDVVVFCTGYQHAFPFLSSHVSASSDVDDDTVRPDVREIWHHAAPSLAYIGFVRPNLGAIPPLAELQAQLWVVHLLRPDLLSLSSGRSGSQQQQILRSEDEPHYRLTSKPGARIRHGVDHESYAYQLALDLDAAPGPVELVRLGLEEARRRRRRRGGNGSSNGSSSSNGNGKLGNNNNKITMMVRGEEESDARDWWWKLPAAWALGANLNAKFRVRGPWKWDGAPTVMAGELWETIARRPNFFGHFTLSIFPMLIFGPLSLLCFLLEPLANLAARVVGSSNKTPVLQI